MSVQPALYIPHGGGPCFFMDWTWGPADSWDKLADWLKNLRHTLPVPQAIVVVSAHWENSAEVLITGHAQPPLLYDYYGFPEHTYQLSYPAPGAPDLAGKIQTHLAAQAIPARIDAERGYDHGVFIPLKLIYPEAQIPVVQISLLASLDPARHLEIGKALAPLREEGVLLLGSGMSFHNLRVFGQNVMEQSQAFDAWLTQTLQASAEERNLALADWAKAPSGRFCHPREEHLLPLMVVAGAAESAKGEKVFTDAIMGSQISAFQFN
ncbi:dioxygenase [bacterium (Candidatus Blackallbacteria) CG17_big_fil_post_rev_8_21_14_2_50_48_46]|uniref:Dioxygenase n=1 Tax=bacterium (Candidatus Blackallbacteria) CG17_big_fil_post_rev_8_21_14_2_50_48_46 TaxID=2014261 RepID=A0A2M7G2W7_9BACT|nr:MAG: dioxygenase [bacterium (Candidatus Blackallbacteria) CG18_big_fil_WC_8_21_14_2_50_49_26]PIW16156.1 MAG: dioxygenase [bacterium (Candidatus Blackallbacteria) CG17_big_fil_post_rev_8_21_14_2_50_48_46]PIW44243.1 MAG: dioxygenase [bacterium (Candidatus Blackallbacteria) CG13_big_fil_rev_8_21_14_2_50_49_14]